MEFNFTQPSRFNDDPLPIHFGSMRELMTAPNMKRWTEQPGFKAIEWTGEGVRTLTAHYDTGPEVVGSFVVEYSGG